MPRCAPFYARTACAISEERMILPHLSDTWSNHMMIFWLHSYNITGGGEYVGSSDIRTEK